MSSKSYLKRNTAVVIAAAALLFAPGAVSSQSNAPGEKFTANAINISEIGRPGATPLDIVVTRWSTEAERQRLVTTVTESGPDALLKVIQDNPKAGYIRTPTSLAWDLRFAHQVPAEGGGRRIILATDRPIGFREAVQRPRTIDYPFTVIEIHMPAEGTGEGKISLATRITGDKRKNTIELENFASQPVMLTEVRKVN